MEIEIQNLTRVFGTFTALDQLSLQIPSGELTALLGPSGCGKTTLLRIISGLEVPDSGQVLFDGENAERRTLRERGVGFVFQHYALFRHMNVFENIAFGLRVKPKKTRPSEEFIRSRVRDLLALVQLEGLAARMPSELSGGQRQRVALARALAVEPGVLLLDEPFGALDAGVRRELRRWLRRLHDEVKVTSVFVTHDQEEALEVADRVVVMNRGRVEQVGSPEEVYRSPASPFVVRFLGDVNLFHARQTGDELNFKNAATPGEQDDRTALVYVRPHEIELTSAPVANSLFPARIERVRKVGPVARVELVDEHNRSFEAEVNPDRQPTLSLESGKLVYVSLRAKQVFFSDSDDYSI